MLKMIIRMDDTKISTEKIYSLDSICHTIDQAFLSVGLPRIEEQTRALVYRDCGRTIDFGLFGKIVNDLKKQAWFMDNVKV